MGDLAIETRSLTKSFKGRLAVDRMDLQVPRGAVYGLLGPNGAGKTTTMHLLLGLLAPTGGTATVMGLDPQMDGGKVRGGCGVLLEHHGLYERMSALQNLDYYGRINRMSAPERARRAKDALDSIGLWDRRKEVVGKWSKGMKQKLAITRALLNDPPLVFLDEPTAGHDPASAKELRDHLVALVRGKGTTVFLTTHNLTEAEAVCATVGILQEGRLIAQQSPQDMRTAARHERLIIQASGVKPALVAKIKAIAHVGALRQEDGVLELAMEPGGKASPVVKALVDGGAQVEEVRREKATLEEAYLRLTREASP